jgi:alpha-tubulin suppressor-like RCC1 family protein
VSIKTDGTLWSWGRNNEGELGLNNITNYSSPKQIGALTTWLNIVCGAYHTLATKTNGTLWPWGLNAYGQLGLGNTTDYSSPVQVGSNVTWSKIAGGSDVTLAILP